MRENTGNCLNIFFFQILGCGTLFSLGGIQTKSSPEEPSGNFENPWGLSIGQKCRNHKIVSDLILKQNKLKLSLSVQLELGTSCTYQIKTKNWRFWMVGEHPGDDGWPSMAVFLNILICLESFKKFQWWVVVSLCGFNSVLLWAKIWTELASWPKLKKKNMRCTTRVRECYF